MIQLNLVYTGPALEGLKHFRQKGDRYSRIVFFNKDVEKHLLDGKTVLFEFNLDGTIGIASNMDTRKSCLKDLIWL